MEICNRQQLHMNTLAWFGRDQIHCLSKASPGPLQSLSNKNWRGRRLGLAQYTLYRLFSPASHLILSPGIINQHTDYPDWPDMDEEEEEINKSEPPFGERLFQSFCELVPIFRAVFEILLC